MTRPDWDLRFDNDEEGEAAVRRWVSSTLLPRIAVLLM